MSKFVIQVNRPAYGASNSYQALSFAKAAIAHKHEIIQIFFYQAGVLSANSFNRPATDEFDVTREWIALGEQHGIPLVTCIAAALRRGVLSESESMDYQQPHWNLEPPFTMGGLGALITAIEQADRVVCF